MLNPVIRLGPIVPTALIPHVVMVSTTLVSVDVLIASLVFLFLTLRAFQSGNWFVTSVTPLSESLRMQLKLLFSVSVVKSVKVN